MTLWQPLKNQRGLTLMMVLVMVTVVGLAAGLAGTSWKTVVQQAREKELLWRGEQYRKAIGSYYRFSAGTGQRPRAGAYPDSLEDLLKDPRSLETLRHIRRLYPDPMTGGEWALIRDPGGRIMGVRSSSSLKPFQQDNFSEENRIFKGKAEYRAWEFVYRASSSPGVQNAGERSATR
ncbi:type II secretion system protein [Desulfuromonas sp. AOP6]|uniref:type II secretion system protein n=1 Tax=Desulfuromonas sp. AOP6 TaxID=1566351 RepID=UPI00127F0CC9|nr:type II secretion system protein [Desulfuromonas sp. AOP6]BCA80169.1 type II secretion system pseudopilin TklG [Desulfuromonas sp. AOP6]